MDLEEYSDGYHHLASSGKHQVQIYKIHIHEELVYKKNFILISMFILKHDT